MLLVGRVSFPHFLLMSYASLMNFPLVSRLYILNFLLVSRLYSNHLKLMRFLRRQNLTLKCKSLTLMASVSNRKGRLDESLNLSLNG
jgi:hypothetical protein